MTYLPECPSQTPPPQPSPREVIGQFMEASMELSILVYYHIKNTYNEI